MDDVNDGKKVQLTTEELQYFKDGVLYSSKFILGLKITLLLCLSPFLIFMIAEWIHRVEKGEDYSWLIYAFLFWIGCLLLCLGCIKIMNKRNNRIYLAIIKGDCQIIVSSITKKDYRRIGSGRRAIRIDYYECPKFQGEIIPCSGKQFQEAKVGDRLKVVIIPKLHRCYGVIIRNECAEIKYDN